ncbi:hypothetical protein BDF20DRAFT_419578 [Mycotypha africana]|uniref:uncharacterized protein n=1 Tax=Mycotypha africana TaxID=64632 RepID=UPI0023018E83|nr:uncharacterized protein BDF20DRAFT_419578 [Mycotypha africana]KAI8981673.1 hypothetical protein BDF20DRAFT_419578 [Mycotypha africana]
MDFKSLSQYDDVLTDYFVDKLHLWFNTTRMNASMDCTFDERDEAIRIIQKDILVKGSTSVAAKNAAASFLKLPYFKNLTKNYSQTELKNFKHHLSLYLYMFSPRAGYEIASTVRYTGEMEGCVLAIRDWQAGEKVSCCVGTVAILSEEDDQALRDEGRDFSVMISTRYNTARLFLGPAKFMNHDCEANCRFVAEGSRVTFYTTKPIKCGEEMTVFYGDHYFGDGNCECRCASCQR